MENVVQEKWNFANAQQAFEFILKGSYCNHMLICSDYEYK